MFLPIAVGATVYFAQPDALKVCVYINVDVVLKSLEPETCQHTYYSGSL